MLDRICYPGPDDEMTRRRDVIGQQGRGDLQENRILILYSALRNPDRGHALERYRTRKRETAHKNVNDRRQGGTE